MEPLKFTTIQKMRKFIGDIKVRTFKELVKSNENGLFVVVAWFVSVAEGIDMWYHDVSVKSKPRFRMKLKVKDEEEEAVFSLFDADVEFLATETCPLLRTLEESCSIFPDEMDCYYGDAILYQVEKEFHEEDGNVAKFKVVSICNEVDVVNKFIDEFRPDIENIVPISFLETIYPKDSSQICGTNKVSNEVLDDAEINVSKPQVVVGVNSSQSVVPIGGEFIIESKPTMKTDYLGFQKYKTVLINRYNNGKRSTQIDLDENEKLTGQKRTKH